MRQDAPYTAQLGHFAKAPAMNILTSGMLDSPLGDTNQGLDMARINLTQNLGMLLLGIWLIVNGLIALLGLSFQGLPLLMGILALAAGILILLRR